MKPHHALLTAVSAAGLLFSAPSQAAKGVIKTSVSGGGTGTIIVSDAGGGFIPEVLPGDPIPFSQPSLELDISDTVNFDIVGPVGSRTAVNVTKISEGTVISGHFEGDISIEPDRAVVVQGGTVAGKVSVNGGVLLVIEDSRVEGTIQISEGGVYFANSGVGRCILSGSPAVRVSLWSFAASSSTGKFTAIQTDLVRIKDSFVLGIDGEAVSRMFVEKCQIDGKVESRGGATISISGCTVNGKLSTVGVRDALIQNNQINGTLTVSSATPCDCGDNQVTGKVTIQP